MSENAVSDSACLIGLERIGRSEILAESFDTVFIPAAVERELGYKLNWLSLRPVRNAAFVKTLRTQLGEGESEAMALAIELNELLVLDDKKARQIAQQIGIEIIGTVGVLLRAKAKGGHLGSQIYSRRIECCRFSDQLKALATSSTAGRRNLNQTHQFSNPIFRHNSINRGSERK